MILASSDYNDCNDYNDYNDHNDYNDYWDSDLDVVGGRFSELVTELTQLTIID